MGRKKTAKPYELGSIELTPRDLIRLQYIHWNAKVNDGGFLKLGYNQLIKLLRHGLIRQMYPTSHNFWTTTLIGRRVLDQINIRTQFDEDEDNSKYCDWIEIYDEEKLLKNKN